MKPVRIQRKRVKGWKMPLNTVSVTRPGKWGNPFYIINEEGYPWVTDARDPTMPVLNLGDSSWPNARQMVVRLFREQCIDALPLQEIRGKNLACWCPITDGDGNPVPCHADVLLELANPKGT